METVPQSEQPRSRRKSEAPAELEVILQPDEVARRKSLRTICQRAHRLDHKFALLERNGSLEHNLDVIQTLDAMNYGDELNCEIVGDKDKKKKKNLNSVTRRQYEGDPPVTAYVKPQLGETSFRYDPLNGAANTITKYFDGTTERLETQQELYASPHSSDPASLLLVQHFHERQENISALKLQIAEHYGIKPKDVPLSEEDFSPRRGVDAGASAIREYSVSRIDNLLGFDTVPLTALRLEEDSSDLASVQQALIPEDPQQPLMELDKNIFKDIGDKGPKHPGARSLMRIACLDYLVKSTDRHPGNVLYDPAAKKFYAIDNSLSLGLCKSDEKGESRMLDAYRSTPLEAIQQHDDWILDDEAVNNIKQLYTSTLKYLELRQIRPELDMAKLEELSSHEHARATGGTEIKFITDLFRQLYGNEKIASREGLEFFQRLEYLIKHRRPPKISSGGEGDQLFEISKHLYKDKPASVQMAATMPEKNKRKKS